MSTFVVNIPNASEAVKSLEDHNKYIDEIVRQCVVEAQHLTESAIESIIIPEVQNKVNAMIKHHSRVTSFAVDFTYSTARETTDYYPRRPLFDKVEQTLTEFIVGFNNTQKQGGRPYYNMYFRNPKDGRHEEIMYDLEKRNVATVGIGIEVIR